MLVFACCVLPTQKTASYGSIPFILKGDAFTQKKEKKKKKGMLNLNK